jgi:hypothetical protein
MKGFLESLKSDLLDRRMIPVVGLLVVLLIAAVAYAVLGGSSSTPATSATSPVTPVAKTPGIAVSQVKTTAVTANAETTSGTSQQTGGSSRNPFTALPSVKRENAAAAAAASAAKAASGASSSGSSESSASSSSGSSTTGGSTSSPAGETAPHAPTKPKAKQTTYDVSVLFGTTTSPGAPPDTSTLTPFNDLTREQPLPSDSQPLVVFRGVLAGGKSATFTLVGEAILRGQAKCLPSTSQCQAIDLQPGQTEELEYFPIGAPAVVYVLQVANIASNKAKSASVHGGIGAQSKSGLALLRRAGLESLPGLRYSQAKGVFVFAGKSAFAARAHASAWSARASAWGMPFKG